MEEPKSLARDVREVIDDQRETLSAVQDALQAKIWTSFPAKVEEYDEKKLTVKVQPLIKSTIRKHDGKIEKVKIPVLEDVPVQFMGAGREDDQQGSQGGGGGGGQGGQRQKKGFLLTFPIKKGDEGVVTISSRAIDHWYDKSDEQEQGTARMHDLSDAFFTPGVRSKKRAEEVEGGADKDKTQFRSVDGKHKYGINEDEDGGLEQDTEANIKSKAKKNIETEAGEMHKTKSKDMERKIEKVETTEAGKAIVKKAAKILLNST